MEDLLSGAILLLLVAGVVFSWVDWRLRSRKLPAKVRPSWDCPHCGIVNEAERTICWACQAAIGRDRLHAGTGAESWQCRQCRAWNGSSRRSCWSCHTAPTSQPKRDA